MEKFKIGDKVYLIHDPDQEQRMITGIMLRPTGKIYQLSLGSSETEHYDIEMSKEKTIY